MLAGYVILPGVTASSPPRSVYPLSSDLHVQTSIEVGLHCNHLSGATRFLYRR